MGQLTMRREGATVLEWVERTGCAHPHFLSFSGKCDGCQRWPLSGSAYPDHYSRQMYAEMDEDPAA